MKETASLGSALNARSLWGPTHCCLCWTSEELQLLSLSALEFETALKAPHKADLWTHCTEMGLCRSHARAYRCYVTQAGRAPAQTAEIAEVRRSSLDLEEPRHRLTNGITEELSVDMLMQSPRMSNCSVSDTIVIITPYTPHHNGLSRDFPSSPSFLLSFLPSFLPSSCT
ncbi:tripartite motif-containing protein 27 [Sarotherodon galilaeus]